MPVSEAIIVASCFCRDNLRTSVDALKELKRVSKTLGQGRTREELIPYISEPHEDNDEHLLVMAQELGGMISHVGGSAYAHVLLKPLEDLTGSDENSVRDAAVVSMQSIIEGMTSEDIADKVVPLMSRLAKGSYPMRVAACALFADVHKRVPDNLSAQLLSDFETLAWDPLPVVRRAAAANLGRLAEIAGQDHAGTFLNVFEQMAQDGTHHCSRFSTLRNYSLRISFVGSSCMNVICDVIAMKRLCGKCKLWRRPRVDTKSTCGECANASGLVQKQTCYMRGSASTNNRPHARPKLACPLLRCLARPRIFRYLRSRGNKVRVSTVPGLFRHIHWRLTYRAFRLDLLKAVGREVAFGSYPVLQK
jgi:hypothetical protein